MALLAGSAFAVAVTGAAQSLARVDAKRVLVSGLRHAKEELCEHVDLLS